MSICHRPISLLAIAVLASASAIATPVTVTELGIGANQIVSIYSSSINGSPWSGQVYAGIVKLKVVENGQTQYTDGFCIDPFHWSASGPQAYNTESLQDAPKPPDGTNTTGMGLTAATEIEQLWAHYYSPTMSGSDAAGLQIAIWTIVDTATSTASFSLTSANDYGAASMISWVLGHPTAPTANVIGLTGPGQDYAADVPDSGTTLLMLALGLASMVLFGTWVTRRGRA